jgi:Xaa-Pro aminopeptidase
MPFELKEFISALWPVDTTKKIPREEFERRVEKVRDELKRRNIDAGICSGPDARWLTGYQAFALITSEVLIFGDERGKADAMEMMKVGEYRKMEELDKSIKNLRRIGILTQNFLIPQLQGKEIIDLSDKMKEWRRILSETEQELLRTAGLIATYGMLALVNSIEPGLREVEVEINGDYVMKYMGAEDCSSGVCSGRRISASRSSNKVIEKGELVILDVTATYEGMKSSIGRTVVSGGELSVAQEKLLAYGERAYKLAVQKIGYDLPSKDLYLAPREYLLGRGLDMNPIDFWAERFPKDVSIEVDVGIFGYSFMDIPSELVGFRLKDPFLINNKGKTERLTTVPEAVWDMVQRE